jgi:hypothetical protein
MCFARLSGNDPFIGYLVGYRLYILRGHLLYYPQKPHFENLFWEKDLSVFYYLLLLKREMENNATPPLKYSCAICNFITGNKYDYTRHLSTQKHKKNAEGDKREIENAPKNPDGFDCECGNKYKYRQGLWSHKKKCDGKTKTNVDNREPPDNVSTNDLVLALINENKEMRNLFIEERKTLIDIIAGLSKNQNNTSSKPMVHTQR